MPREHRLDLIVVDAAGLLQDRQQRARIRQLRADARGEADLGLVDHALLQQEADDGTMRLAFRFRHRDPPAPVSEEVDGSMRENVVEIAAE